MNQNQSQNQKLGYLVGKIHKNSAEEIAWIVKLLENPSSKLSFPGCITLYNHDCLHVLLDEPTNSVGEAFVLGFTMGNASSTKLYHVFIFKLFLKYLYPHPYRLSSWHLSYFDLGFRYGSQINTKDINQIDFYQFKDSSVDIVRSKFNINLSEITLLKQECI